MRRKRSCIPAADHAMRTLAFVIFNEAGEALYRAAKRVYCTTQNRVPSRFWKRLKVAGPVIQSGGIASERSAHELQSGNDDSPEKKPVLAQRISGQRSASIHDN